MSFQIAYDKTLRLTILRILNEAPARTANTAVINSALVSMGFEIGRDKVNSECDWLKEQSLVTIEDLGKVRVIEITHRGMDVAEGRANNSGVERPGPVA